ncbi:MAG: DMT family transporter [Leptolyngbya sp. SIO4C1]|nr:DMT family transporter [Leptolyngbya sp. SIO4C1]
MNSTSNPSRSLFSSLFLIAPFFLWGTAMVAMKGVIPTTTPLFLAGLRLLPAGLLVLLAALYLGRSQSISWRGWLWIGAFALVDGALFQGFLAEGLMRTGAGLGSVMIDSQPLAVAILARFLFQEQVGPIGWLGLLMGLVGIALLGLPDDWIFQLLQGQLPVSAASSLVDGLLEHGEWLMLLAALSMAVGTVMIRYVCRYVDPVVATGWHMVLGGLPLFGLSAGFESQPWQNVSAIGWLAIAYATIFGSAIAYGIFFYLAAQGNLTSLSALTFLTPVFALLFSLIILSESLSSLQWIGVGLTLVSIYLINQRERLAAVFSKMSNLTDTKPSTDI